MAKSEIVNKGYVKKWFVNFLWKHFEVSESTLTAALLRIKQVVTRASISQKDQLKVLKQLGVRLENGLPMAEALQALTEVHKRHSKKSEPVRMLLEQVTERYIKKPNFIEALRPFYPSSTIAIIGAGVESGSVSKAINLAIDILEKQAALSKQMKKGMAVPLLYIGVTLGFMFFVKTQLHSVLLRSLPQRVLELPMIDNSISFTAAVVNSLPITAVLAFVLFIYITWSLPNQNRFRPNNVPPWSLYKASQSAIFLKTFAALQANGQPVIESFKNLEENSSPFSRRQIANIRKKVSRAVPLGKALTSTYFSKEARLEIESYAGTDKFNKILEIIAEEVFEKTSETIQRMTLGAHTIGVITMVAYLIMAMGPILLLPQHLK